MNWRATIAAGLIFIALFAFVWIESQERVAEEGEVFRHRVFGLNLYGIDTEKVSKLRIERKDEETVVLEKRGEKWYITEPIDGMADADKVDRMIKAIAELKPKTKRENVDIAGEQFGLQEPDLVATVTYNENKTATVSLGGETPAGSERYAKVSADDSLYVVSASLRTQLWKDPEGLRAKGLVEIEAEDVQQVTLDHADEHVVAVRTPDSEEHKWALTAPLDTPADEWNVKQVINNVGDLRAEGFLPEDEKEETDLGFDEPQAKVAFDIADAETITITFGNTATRELGEPPEENEIVYTRTSERSEVLLLKADALEKVQKTAFDLRDKSVVSFDREDATRIHVERSEGFSFTVASRPDGWQVEKPKSVPARQSAIDDILWNLEDLSAVEFVTEKTDPQQLREYGLAVPQTAISIELLGRDEPIKVLIGDETSDGDYYAKTSESDRVVKISEFLMGDLPESIDDLEKAEGEVDLPEPALPETELPGAPAPDDG